MLNAEFGRSAIHFEGDVSSNVGVWICVNQLQIGDKVLLSNGNCAIIESVEVEKLSEPEITYNFEVADFHTYYVSDSKVLVHNLCAQDMNVAKRKILAGEDVKLNSKDDAIELLQKKFPDFSQEVAGHRSAQGWHFDLHPFTPGGQAIEHINIYSKKLGFRVHITWRT